MKINFNEGFKILKNLGMTTYINDSSFKPMLKSAGFDVKSVGKIVVAAHVDDVTNQALKDYAFGNNMTKAEVIRDAIRQYVGGK